MAFAVADTAIVLKGTRHGLLASIREDSEWSDVIAELSAVKEHNSEFLKDASLTLDFGWREVSEEQFDQLLATLAAQELGCNGVLSTSLNTRTIAEERGYRAIIGRLGLAQHQGRRLRRGLPPEPAPAAEPVSARPEPSIEASVEASAEFESMEDSMEESFESSSGYRGPSFEDEEPTLYLRKTLRSGQKVVFAGNVVLVGDLNPGAQIEADGDVIVLGQLRGSVHAGCEGDNTATVTTSSLRATQLRIADRFYKAEKANKFFKKSAPSGTLRARLDGETVVVEAVTAR